MVLTSDVLVVVAGIVITFLQNKGRRVFLTGVYVISREVSHEVSSEFSVVFLLFSTLREEADVDV